MKTKTQIRKEIDELDVETQFIINELTDYEYEDMLVEIENDKYEQMLMESYYEDQCRREMMFMEEVY
jgi:hypothetical protein